MTSRSAQPAVGQAASPSPEIGGPYVVLSAERRVGHFAKTPIHCPTLGKACEVAANMAAGDGGEFLVLEVLGTMSARAHWEPAPESAAAPDASSIYP